MKLLAIDGNSILNRAFYGIKLLTTKDGAVLIRFTKTDVTEYTVPETVTSISDNAFAGLEKLTKLTIPPSVKEIESLIAEEKPVEVNCHFCNSHYVFDRDELEEMLRLARE